jgi:hypothetical protein
VNPFDGQVIYMTDVDQTAVWDGTQWTVLAPIAGGRNRIINGDFKVWQRGTSFTPAANAYTADRWEEDATTAYPTSQTISQQTFTPGTAPVSGYEGQFFLRFVYTYSAGNGGQFLTQKVENVRTLAGQTATVSFWAKAGSAISMSNATLRQNFGSGGSTTVETTVGAASLTTSWQRFSFTISVPSVAGKTIGANSFLELRLFMPATSSTTDIWGVQLEAGAVATPFEFEDFGVTLQKCQRYYQKSYNQETAPGATGVTTGVVTTGVLSMSAGFGFAGKTYYSTPMRISPTVTTYSYSAGTTGVISDAGTGGDKTAGSASVIWQGANGFDVYNLSGTGITSSYGFMYHYTASAEL